MINDEQTEEEDISDDEQTEEEEEDISNNDEYSLSDGEIPTAIDQFLDDNKSILQVEDIDGKKKITFKNSNKTETVEGISIALPVVEESSTRLSLQKGLQNGKYLFFSYEGIIYICNVENNKINGNVMEYNEEGKLIFEGEYKNNARKGKGKEYDKNGETIFEGEYKDGERNDGQGKEYDEDGNLIFEGEYKDGKKWKGQENQYFGGELIFEGEYENGEKLKGKEYYNGKLIFEGEYKNNARNGQGKEYYNGKLIFEGEYKNNKRNGKGTEYDKNGKAIFEWEYKDGLRWNGKGKIYLKTKNGYIEKECDYNEGKKNGYEVIKSDNGIVLRIKKYKNDKAVEEFLYVNGEEGSKFELTEDSSVLHTDSTKTNYDDTNVVVYSRVDQTLSDTMRKIRDKFGERTQLLTKLNRDHEPDEDIKIAENTDKLELFINFHGAANPEYPICLRDIRPISNKVSNAIVGSKGQIQTLTIKLINCHGRTYDVDGNDLKAELLKDIYTKAVEKAKKEEKELDLHTLPTILISGATIDSLVATYASTNNKEKVGCKRVAKKEYFSFDQQEWKKVAEIIEKHNKNNKNTINDKNGKMDKELNDNLVSLFEKTNKENYRQLKGYYKNRDNINNNEATKTEHNKGNNIKGV